LGANAFALSCTTLTFTDDLVELASDDEELLAVYLHELGHARLRHVERSLLQSSAWLVMLTLITGDLSGVGELILSLPLVIGQTAYSREFERAADEFAVDALIEAGVSPLKLATILERLEQSHMQRRSQPDSAHKQGEAQANPEKSVDEAAFEDEERVERDRVEDAADSRSRDVSTEADEVSTEDVAAKPSQVARVLFDYLSTHPATSERVAYIKSRAAQL
jgi:Zn-dependent protease with chaperone function